MPNASLNSHKVTRLCGQLVLAFALITILNGCAQVISVTTSEPIQIKSNERTLGTKINDQQLETIARVNLNNTSRQFEEAHVNIDSFNGLLLLSGQVPSEELRITAGETVGKINTVRQVHNELTVGKSTDIQARTKDSWITTKIKSKLVASSIQSSRIVIITEAQTVFLMGLVSRHEAERITNVAKNTAGVTQVVKVFEYVD
ncbi:MAG TPA: BON domain-containing protein [Cellvibrio sp.]|nr:BON domain-containing protein [Cellvibrio sp.]